MFFKFIFFIPLCMRTFFLLLLIFFFMLLVKSAIHTTRTVDPRFVWGTE
jgi:hypothetical protein